MIVDSEDQAAAGSRAASAASAPSSCRSIWSGGATGGASCCSTRVASFAEPAASQARAASSRKRLPPVPGSCAARASYSRAAAAKSPRVASDCALSIEGGGGVPGASDAQPVAPSARVATSRAARIRFGVGMD